MNASKWWERSRSLQVFLLTWCWRVQQNAVMSICRQVSTLRSDLPSQVDSSATGHLTDMPAGQMLLLVLWSIYPALSTCPGSTRVSIHLETTRVCWFFQTILMSFGVGTRQVLGILASHSIFQIILEKRIISCEYSWLPDYSHCWQ